MDDRHYIGGTGAATVCGKNPYTSPYQLWQRLKNPEPEKPPSRYIYWGVVLEPVIRTHYMVLHQCQVSSGYAFGQYVHPVYPWARATPDGIIGRELGLEIKTADASQARHWGKSGTGKVPIQYMYQCQWYMWITGIKAWDLVVLIGGNDYREYRIEYDDEHARKTAACALEFWTRYIDGDEIPPRIAAKAPSRDTIEVCLDDIGAIDTAVSALVGRKQTLENRIASMVDASAWNLSAIEALSKGQ